MALCCACHVQAVDAELFKCLQEIHGKAFHSFIARKLVPVVGDIRENNLGIAQELAHKIQDEVDIIVNSGREYHFPREVRFVIEYVYQYIH